MKFDLAGQIMCAHVSEFAVGTYKKAHFHGPGAHVLILSGKGTHCSGRSSPRKRLACRWGPGSLIVPPELWLHMHLNFGAEPARYLALRWNNWHFPFVRMVEGSRRESIKLGGTQLEYEDEDPKIHAEFEAALFEAGATCRMGERLIHFVRRNDSPRRHERHQGFEKLLLRTSCSLYFSW